MDVASDRHCHQCWICDGTGRASLFADSTDDICAMCRGSGLVATVPSTASEMVEALLAVPDLPRRKLSFEDEVRIDVLEEIVRGCIEDMIAEGEW